jgi:branched-chain amino acid transport system ATP-binding protein
VPPLLELERVRAGYGRVQILHDLSVSVPAGRVVALLGPNGAGKTTTLRCIAGLLPLVAGRIRFDGRRIDGRPPHEVARAGVLLVPEGRGIFPGLTVRENLEIAARAANGAAPASIDEAVAVFPRLGERINQVAGTLSGGEQQMLALSRALLGRPRLLLVDEISMGLAPLFVERLFEALAELRRRGMTIVLVEQYLTHALRLADICYVLAKGRVAFVGEPAELRGGEVLAGSYLGRS